MDNSRIHFVAHMLAILLASSALWWLIWELVALSVPIKLGLCTAAYIVVAFVGHHASPRLIGPLLERLFPTRPRG